MAEESADRRGADSESLAVSPFIGESETVRVLLEQARKAAQGSWPVLIQGPIGSGKSHLARTLHAHSPRAGARLVFVDCGAPDLDNMLVGHRRGAFTGAMQSLRGRLELARGGTVVLDDFDRLDHRHQDQLHRVVVDGVFYPLGSDEPVKTDVRFIATTNKNLSEEVEAGRLKADFVSRLDYFVLTVPALHDHPEDIPALCRELMRRHLERDSDGDRHADGDAEAPVSLLSFDDDCWPALFARRFHDNVRGLDKLVARLIAHVGGRGLVTPRDIDAVSPTLTPLRQPWYEQPRPLRVVRDAAERRYILEVCQHTNFNLRKAARILQISPKSLYEKLRRYQITRP